MLLRQNRNGCFQVEAIRRTLPLFPGLGIGEPGFGKVKLIRGI
jgi:hypothetical protein